MAHKRKLLMGIFLLTACVCTGCGASKKPEITNLRTNYSTNPMGVDDEELLFSWQMNSDEQDKRQSAYQITVYENTKRGSIEDNRTDGIIGSETCVWDSGKVISGLSVAIPYEGKQLKSQTGYEWSVTVWDEKNNKCISTENGYFETGLMGKFPEEAHWISVGDEYKDTSDSYSDVTAYSIGYTMEIRDTSACFVFGAESGRYGSMTLCELQNQGEETVFTVKNMTDLNSNVEFLSADIDTAEDGIYRVELLIQNQQMEAVINHCLVGTFPVQSVSLGAIGYYKSRGTRYAYLDDIVVVDELGNICYKEEFEHEETIFAPYAIVMENGRCKVGSGLMLSGAIEDPAPIFYREFKLEDKEINYARLYLTALGSYEVSMDGQAVSESFLDPGKLAYNQYLSYCTYDVTDALLSRESSGLTHSWQMILFHGWYDRGVGYPEIYSPWGDTNALRGALIVTYSDGTRQIVGTDEEFLVTLDGPIRENDMYQGEFYDASRKECWEKSSLTENGDESARSSDSDRGLVTAHTGESEKEAAWSCVSVDQVDSRYDNIPYMGKYNEPITCIRKLKPISLSEPVSGTYVYDFGQNFAGVCRVTMNAKQGDLVTLRFGEALNSDSLQNKDDAAGTIWTENLLTADATDYYLAIDGEQTYQPVSVYHGFRYLQITGLEEAPSLEQVTGMVLSSDLDTTGEFECSDEIINQYWSNTVWSQKSNFLDNPTDCAQRDERHGWAGDAQIFSGMACYNSNSDNFYRKYLNELCSLQNDDGAFPDMAPRNFGTGWDGRGGAGGNNCWGDAAVVIAWNLYTQYGDEAVLREHYDALCKWIDYLVEHSQNGLRPEENGYGDHFSVESTPKGLTDTAWSAHSADLVSEISTILGKEDEAVRYRQIFEQFRDAWLREYVSGDGVIECYSQTAYALGLEFNLFPEEMRHAAGECLLNNVVFNQYEFHAGYAGLPYVLPALSRAGNSDAAYEMLCNRNANSLLYPVIQGATTTPEYLSAYQEADGRLILDGSLNHYAYGAPAEWLYTNVLGIRSDDEQPGFKHFYIRPETTGRWSYAKGAYESMYGRIEVSWEQQENGYSYRIRIPANSTATVELPGMDDMELGSGEYQFLCTS